MQPGYETRTGSARRLVFRNRFPSNFEAGNDFVNLEKTTLNNDIDRISRDRAESDQNKTNTAPERLELSTFRLTVGRFNRLSHGALRLELPTRIEEVDLQECVLNKSKR